MHKTTFKELTGYVDVKMLNIIKAEYERLGIEMDEDKDVYSYLASKLYNIPYEECLEYKDDKPYPKGKFRRQYVKFALVGIFCMQNRDIDYKDK